MADKKVGTVKHYFNKIGVAAIVFKVPISVGDKIKFVRNGQEIFQQEVASLQKEHENITKVKKGDDIGMKVDKPVKEGMEVFKVE
jgi:translation initiation factor IF-2